MKGFDLGAKKIPTPQKGKRCRKIKHTMRKHWQDKVLFTHKTPTITEWADFRENGQFYLFNGN